MEKNIKQVLSIQSHVVFGHAGNSAAVFPMQRLGVNVWPIHTVQFSNHTQYPEGWTGMSLDALQIPTLLDGIAAIGQLSRCDAVLSGYLGAASQAEAVLDAVAKVKDANPNALYLCDPVMGHPGKGSGCVVAPGIEAFLVETMPDYADILTPNHSELERMVGRALNTTAAVLSACRELLARGPSVVLVKHTKTHPDVVSEEPRFSSVVVTQTAAWYGDRPLYPFPRQPVGVGDVISGVFLARYLQLGGDDAAVRSAFEHTLAACDAVLKQTFESNTYELALVAVQDEIARPKKGFPAQALPFD